MAQNTKHIQEAMNNYDYEKVIALIDKEKPTTELLFQKGKALRSLSRNAEALNAFQANYNKRYSEPTRSY